MPNARLFGTFPRPNVRSSGVTRPRKCSLGRLRFFETNTVKLTFSGASATVKLTIFEQWFAENFLKSVQMGLGCVFLRSFSGVLHVRKRYLASEEQGLGKDACRRSCPLFRNL